MMTRSIHYSKDGKGNIKKVPAPAKDWAKVGTSEGRKRQVKQRKEVVLKHAFWNSHDVCSWILERSDNKVQYAAGKRPLDAVDMLKICQYYWNQVGEVEVKYSDTYHILHIIDDDLLAVIGTNEQRFGIRAPVKGGSRVSS